MTTPGFEERSGRETRLLVLVVVVALAVLVLLARFRFPASELTAMAPAPGPLAGLAARATFDEMTSSLTDLLARVAPAITVVPLERTPEPKTATEKGRGAKTAPETTPPIAPPARLTPALRLRPDLALVHVPVGLQIAASTSGQLTTIATDVSREVALVRFAAAVPPGALLASFDGFSGFSYVGIVEGAPGGPTMRPLFIGRTDPWPANTLWSKPPLLIGHRGGVEAGAVVFSIDGRLLGMALPSADGIALVTPSALDAAVTELLGIGGSAP
jgi:hypothetical protein